MPTRAHLADDNDEHDQPLRGGEPVRPGVVGDQLRYDPAVPSPLAADWRHRPAAEARRYRSGELQALLAEHHPDRHRTRSVPRALSPCGTRIAEFCGNLTGRYLDEVAASDVWS